ncbi:MAG: glycerol-3-phosphate 1-O-acyltransferase PlsY [Opitutales bacterium]|nr:glycerol-3-phosphate 1-O-acyltransferase PlsY [Opitutales bacterium]
MDISILLPAAALVAGYFLGSLPFAVIVARRCGVDILHAGSGNPGATNVKRCCGKKAGNTVFFLDMAKGFVAAFWPFVFGAVAGTAAGDVAVAQLCGFIGAVLGHCFSIFLKFKGGKGVSTTIGGLLGAMPLAILVALLVWLAVYFACKIVAVASIAFGLALPIITMIYAKCGIGHYTNLEIVVCLALAVFIIVMHQSNIRRLIAGKENTFKKTDKKEGQ